MLWSVTLYRLQTWATRKEDIKDWRTYKCEYGEEWKEISWTEHTRNNKLRSACKDWRGKGRDTETKKETKEIEPRMRQRKWNQERDKGNGTDLGC